MTLTYFINPGEKFDTEFEKGCVTQEVPDFYGNFTAIDSEGQLVQFNTAMVTVIY